METTNTLKIDIYRDLVWILNPETGKFDKNLMILKNRILSIYSQVYFTIIQELALNRTSKIQI